MSRAPSSVAVPSRPRLADHVAARRHVVDGAEWIVLHDTLQDRAARIGPREWTLLRAADGTRDLDGILAAAAAQDRHARREHLEVFLRELHAVGMLADGPSRARAAGDSPSIDGRGASVRADGLLDPLAGFLLDCDGGGSCCRIYPTTLFAPQESVRARALCPTVVDEGWDEERTFTPARGGSFWGEPGRPGARSVVMIDGRCGYQTTAGECALHRGGGAEAKPLGCQLYPAVFVDDGAAIRVSVAPECACVFRSLGGEGGAPLVPAGARRASELDPRVFVRRLPERIALDRDQEIPRLGYLPWAGSFATYWQERHAACRDESAADAVTGRGSDPARALWSAADVLDAKGLAWEATARALEEPAPWRDEVLSRWLMALRRRLAQRRDEDASWRGEQDWARAACAWLLRGVDALLRAAPAWPPGRPRVAEQQVELFYLWALAHGHGMVREIPLSAALRDHAVRLLVARAMAGLDDSAAPSALEPAARAYPLALVEALLRGHGLQAYASSVGWGLEPAEPSP